MDRRYNGDALCIMLARAEPRTPRTGHLRGYVGPHVSAVDRSLRRSWMASNQAKFFLVGGGRVI